MDKKVSILYLIIGDLLYYLITYNFTMWKFNPIGFDKHIYANHVLITLGIDFINFPAVVLLYLGNYPDRKSITLQAIYIMCWSALNSILEYIFFIVSGVSYDNGWNFWWSASFNILLYTLLRIHHLRPLLAWLISAAIPLLYCYFFKLPLNSMK
ncbi:CBO0543 family protein [Paenibacillus hexagrammi]|uniref:Uncharacterized protein n=1 Tax=Paenibacillus hexagrammi TaxID=2908839 RepID=A0ABY3SN97_9BACL|nr:CBO0543 family protein [Paenibacillus sp. YPD9-1]UJF35194.1 hypothetical protein L0M14_08750 [Paenibacillus sp. YPD9-1]